MRNLLNVGHLEVDLGLPPDVGHVRFAADDDENGAIYVAGSGLTIACLSAATLETRWIADIGDLAPAAGCDLPPDSAPTAISFSPDLAALTIGLSSGHLLLLHPPAAPSAGAPALEEVGVLGGGVAGAAWSPDGDAFAVLSGAGQLLLMTPEWEVLWEAPVADNAPAFPQPDAVPGPLPLGGDAAPMLSPANASLSWRGDGKYVATCTVDVEPLDGSKQPARVRVWDRESGGLHALGVAAAGLRAVTAWQPNGRHLYVAQYNAIGGSAEEAEAESTHQNGNGAATVEVAEAERGPQGQAPEVRHVGAWKRELRRREAAAAAAGAAPSANHILLVERNGLQHGGFDVPAAPTALGGADGHDNAQAVESMAWSPDSTVLAVVLGPKTPFEAGRADEAGAHRTLQLWHRSNWHWYLKYERRYADCEGLVAVWGSSVAGGGLALRVITAEGAASTTTFVWTPCTSALGTAAVVDGAAVLLTPLREGIVPPPLCAAAVALPAPPAALALRQRAADEREALAAVLSDSTIAVIESVEEDLWEESLEEQEERRGGWTGRGPPRLLPRLLALPEGYAHRVVRQAAWVSDSSLLLVLAGEASNPTSSGSSAGGEDDLLEIDLSAALDLPEDSPADFLSIAGTAREVSCLPAPGRVVACAAVAPGWPAGGAAVQLDSGEVWGYYPGGSIESLPHGAAFPAACPRMAAPPPLPAGEGPAGALASPSAALGLSTRGELWWGGRQIATGVTSFALRHRGPGGPFLLYTTRAHTLRTLPLSSVFDASLPSAPSGAREYAIPELKLQAAARRRGTATETDVTVRAIEEGSLLVACPANSIDVVYQAPRGNLETARPRALTLPAVAAALDAGDFAAAWRLATVNRLDLNVLVDYRWPRFLGQARAFLEGVASDVDAADFVAGLAPASVTAPGGLYAAALTALHVPIDAIHGEGGSATQDKVPAVCTAVRAAVEELCAGAGAASSPAAWLRTEVTTHSRCGDLPAALRRIKAVREAELESAILSSSAGTIPGTTAPSTSSVTTVINPKTAATAEQGLRHLLLYRTEEDVYRAALGSYELELSYMVVTHSQKDPGEYLLQLQRFAAIADPALRRHAIDTHLGRWPSALRALYDAGDAHFDAALALAREKGLLRLFLKLVGPEKAGQRAFVHAAAGEDLETRGKHEDAALAFIAAGDLEKALRAYRLAGAWRQALGLAARLGRDAERLSALAARLAADLADSHRHPEAAAVTLEYLGDVPQGVRLLAEGGEWAEASRVAWARGRGDLLESIIAPAAAVAAARLLENSQEDVERVRKYWTRLQELRGKRAAVAAAVAEAETLAGLAPRDDDLETEAASMVSGMSAYTDATAAGSTALSSASATTVGGRRAGGGKKKKGKAGKSSGRIRQGSPEEEAQLGRHLLSLAPLPSTCTEAGQLTEVLVALGHEDDAATLQRTLKTLIDEQRAAVADLVAHPPPGLALVPGPAAVERAAATGGAIAVAALEAAAAEVPGGELVRCAAEGEAAAKRSVWKWEVLREAEDEETGGDDKGK